MGYEALPVPTPFTSRSTSVCSDKVKHIISWKDIHCKVRTPRGEDLELIHGVSGSASSGELVALVGPSGAGKSCFLDILTCRKTVGKLTGSKTCNGMPMTASCLRAISSYVTQEDPFHPTQTVMESVMFHALMRLDYTIPYGKKEAMAHGIISLAGLKGKEHQRVGGLLPGGIRIRGLSGGEKRRLSLCCASITSPDVLFADEPTSGLDSMAALMIIKMLRRFCDEGMIIFCTIHQPRQDIWVLFDKVLVLANGYQLFYGSPGEAESWFTSTLGVQRPALTCPADFILDQANIDFDKSDCSEPHALITLEDLKRASDGFMNSDTMPMLDVEVGQLQASNESIIIREGASIGWLTKYSILLVRNYKNYIRNLGNVVARLVITVVAAVVCGMVYRNMGAREKTPQLLISILGAIFVGLFTMNLLPFASFSSFLYDRQFFQGENAAGIYPVSAYYAANVTLEVLFNSINAACFATITYVMIDFHTFIEATSYAPALGYVGIITLSSLVANALVLCTSLASPNLEVAFVLAAAYQCISIYTSGLVVQIPSMDSLASSLHYISILKYSLQAILYLFFKGTRVEPYMHATGLDKPDSLGFNLLACSIFYLVFALVGFLCLKYLYKEKR